jgi:hypothetical protein
MFRFTHTLLVFMVLIAGLSFSNAQALPGGACPEYNGSDGQCTGTQPRDCTVGGEDGLCHNVTDHKTGDEECRCLAKKTVQAADSASADPLAEIFRYDPSTDPHITIEMASPDTQAPAGAENNERRPGCIGIRFPQGWYPSGCGTAQFGSACVLVARGYAAGEYKKSGGGVLRWPGGGSPFGTGCKKPK